MAGLLAVPALATETIKAVVVDGGPARAVGRELSNVLVPEVDRKLAETGNDKMGRQETLIHVAKAANWSKKQDHLWARPFACVSPMVLVSPIRHPLLSLAIANEEGAPCVLHGAPCQRYGAG